MAKISERKESPRFDVLRAMDRLPQRSENPLVEAVDPGMDRDFLTSLPSILDDRGAGDVAALGKDVEFAKSIELRSTFERG